MVARADHRSAQLAIVWWYPLVIVVGTLVGIWLLFAAFLLVARPDRDTIHEAMRLLPDTMRLAGRLATDRTIPLPTRMPAWLLIAYLASPIDLIPDFVPVIGYADDAIVTSVVLRRLIRRAGPDKLQQHWPGSTEGLAHLQRLLRIGDSDLATTEDPTGD